jgi:hypothetical protein
MHGHGAAGGEPSLAEPQPRLHGWTQRGTVHWPGKAVWMKTHQNGAATEEADLAGDNGVPASKRRCGGQEHSGRSPARPGGCLECDAHEENKRKDADGAAHREERVGSGAARCTVASMTEGWCRQLDELLRGAGLLLDLRTREDSR